MTSPWRPRGRRAATCVAGILSLAVVAGCASAPPRRPPDTGVETPPAWTAPDGAAAGSEAPPEEGWWRSFEDPVLDDIVRTALDENHDLKAAGARLEAAAAEARIASADLKPVVGAGLDFTRQRFNFIGFPIPGGEEEVLSTTYSRYDLGVDVAWEIDLWGKLRAGARAALADLQASEAELYGARLSLAGEAVSSWFAVLEARQQVKLARDTVTSWRRSTEQIRSRFTRGLRPAVDLRLAEANLAAAEALAAARSLELDVAVRRLEILLGRYPAGELLARHGGAELPASPGPVPVGMPADLIARRPDLVAAERRLAAADQRALQARRSLYPSLTLTGSGGTASEQLRDLLDGDFRVWSLIAGLATPIFQGGRLRAGVQLADAGVRATLETYINTALAAYAEVESALAAEDLLARRESHEQDSARQLTAARRLAEDRYYSGIGDYLTVLDSQTRELTTLSRLIVVRRARLENRVDLHLALGGGFDVAAGRTGVPGLPVETLAAGEEARP